MLTRHSNFDISVKERMNCPLTLWKILICRLTSIFSLIKKKLRYVRIHSWVHVNQLLIYNSSLIINDLW